MFESTIRRLARGMLPVLMMLVAGGSVVSLVEPLAAQAAGNAQESPPADGETPIEWNFRPEPVGSPTTEISLQERWAAPFAVISQGRPAPRTRREVVVLRDSVAARRVATAQAATGQSVAEVTLEEDEAESESAPATGEAADPDTEAVDGGNSTADEGGEEDDDEPSEEESGPSRPPTTPPAAGARESSTGGARTHRVEYGETWFGLAREYRISSRELAAANPDVDPERLQAGTLLRIPAAGSADAAPRRHTVIRGDTLFGIARRYGVSPEAIRSANRLQNDVVRLGQTLVIP